MHRTTIILPEPLKLKLQQFAKKQNVSFGKLIRQALEKFVFSQNNPSLDSFLASTTVFNAEGPGDGAEKHDQYIYGRSPHGGV